jgi:hypothetical protein
MDMKLGSLVSLAALIASACGLSTSVEDPPGPGEVDVPIGEEVALPGSIVRLAFTAVTGDSRCPLGVVCVWEGDAAVSIALTAGTGPTQPFELHSALDPRFVDFAGVRVTLVGLSPYPREGESIDPDDYVARFGTGAITP